MWSCVYTVMWTALRPMIHIAPLRELLEHLPATQMDTFTACAIDKHRSWIINSNWMYNFDNETKGVEKPKATLWTEPERIKLYRWGSQQLDGTST